MAIIQNPKTLDLKDIQGMVTRGYSKLFKTAYFSLGVVDASKAKEWIKDVLPEVDVEDEVYCREQEFRKWCLDDQSISEGNCDCSQCIHHRNPAFTDENFNNTNATFQNLKNMSEQRARARRFPVAFWS